MFREPPPRPRQPSRIKRPALFWTIMAGILVILALFIPRDWTSVFSTMFGERPAERLGAWSDPIDELDARLRAGEALAVDEARWREVRPLVQVRRLYDVGPMNVASARRAEAIFREFNPRVDAQTRPGSRDALRAERDRRLAEALPRLDPGELRDALATLRAQVDASSSR